MLIKRGLGFGLVLVWGPHPAVLGTCSWLYAQGATPGGTRGLNVIFGIELHAKQVPVLYPFPKPNISVYKEDLMCIVTQLSS